MNTNFLNSVTNFIKKRTFEFLGLILISSSIVLAISFVTYSPEDPSFIYGDSSIEIIDSISIKNNLDLFLGSVNINLIISKEKNIDEIINSIKNNKIKYTVLNNNELSIFNKYFGI